MKEVFLSNYFDQETVARVLVLVAVPEQVQCSRQEEDGDELSC
jgi:hypothetical protein